MDTRHVDRLVRGAALACLVVIALPDVLAAQSRKEVRLPSVGSIPGPGDMSPSRAFRDYSYGLGGLRSYTPGAGGDVLRSSIGDAGAGLVMGRPPAGEGGLSASGLTTDLIRPAGSSIRYDATGSQITDLGGRFSTPRFSGETSVMSSARAYLEAIGATSALSAGRTQPITSLAPTDSSPYSKYMREGERYFRQKDYYKAFNEFQLANFIDEDDPSSLLSMAHATFATSSLSYYAAAYYLRQAIDSFQELPVMPLQPRDFFGERAEYAKRLTLLEERVNRAPADAEALLLLAYFRWFDGGTEAACAALSKAHAASKGELKKSIEGFWKGMVASGKVSGTLEQPIPRPAASTTKAATGPTSTTAPAAPASKPGE